MLHDRPLERVEASQYAETFAGKLEELDRRAVESGHPGLIAQSDQVHAHVRVMHKEVLQRFLRG